MNRDLFHSPLSSIDFRAHSRRLKIW